MKGFFGIYAFYEYPGGKGPLKNLSVVQDFQLHELLQK